VRGLSEPTVLFCHVSGSAAVAFMSYTNMTSLLDANLYHTTNNTVKTMMSSVVSATLPKTNNTHFTKPVNFTLEHTAKLKPEGNLSCVYWKDTEWVVDGCYIVSSNNACTICSCVHLSTFSLIMETNKGYFISTSQIDLLEEILKSTFTELPQDVVIDTLMKVMIDSVIKETSDWHNLAHVNDILAANEKLVSALVTYTETYRVIPITLPNLEIQIFMIGPNASLTTIPPLNTSTSYLEIDLVGIAKKNNGSAAVALISYTNVTNMLVADDFVTAENTNKTMMSTVVSATLMKTTKTALTKPVNLTMKHIAEFRPEGILSCVYWDNTRWTMDGCYLLLSNSTHSVCSCDHLSTFALIMQINLEGESDFSLELLNTVAVVVGLVFLSLALLTFALCRRNPRVNNIARMNLCLNLFLAHLLFLLTQSFLQYIRPVQVVCAVVAGVLHFLYLSAFLWMFIEAVLLFISVKNLTKIRSKQTGLLNRKYLIVIGYAVPLIVVGVSAGLVHGGYGSEKCWIKADTHFVWSFLGPVCCILTLNLIIFIFIIISLRATLARQPRDHSQSKRMKTIVFKTLVQFVILGCPWILGFFTKDNKVLEIVFLCLNSQQGTFIFLVHCVLNQEVSHLLF
ncbi:hypothetical protein NFI96_017191, partial [Prochilodus magdalenae]